MGYVIFGKKIAIKSIGCNTVDVPGHIILPSVNIFVKVTKGCNAGCLFCSNTNADAIIDDFNQDKFFEIIQELKRQRIIINRINITGGEPSVATNIVLPLLEECENEKYKEIHLHLNTNGLLPRSKKLMQHPRWNSISISLHYYEHNKLSEIYGVQISRAAFDFDGIEMSKVNASCNLIRGYIDSAVEVHRILDFIIELGIPRVGFVSLMKINEYCEQHYVDFDEIRFEDIPHVYFTNSMNRGKNCKCSNYLYNKDLKILEIYMRNYMNPQYCESSLVYDGMYLRQGFQDNNIVY